ncbi:MAG: hypothetical protein CL470_02585 [Acidimicrobiaceae bacterium]|nr:hypothetical protein [Acidimicrobiaceae bacterium]|tara:strand:- start:14755 stop:15084 length:330 start_codon:yes stop_codon:yes gene_type:complete
MINFQDNNDALDGKPAESLQGSSDETHRCEESPALITQALEGAPNPQLIQAVRNHLGGCMQCLNALDLEIRFKLAMAQRATDKAPPSLQLRISESLQRIDLGDITISDL